MDTIRRLKVIVSIADEGSLAAAGRKLSVSLPTVSRVLADFEKTADAPLFERSARQCRLTEAGQIFVDRARQITLDYGEMLDVAAGVRRQPKGKVRMTAPLTFGRMHVMPAICTFLQEHPGIDVGLHLTDAVVDMASEGFDLGVRIGEVEAPSLIARRIGSVTWWTVASPDYLEKHGTPHAADDLTQHQWIQHSRLEREEFLQGQKATRRPAVLNTRLIVNDASSALEAARRGLGITSLLSYQAAADVTEGKLLRILPDLESKPHPISLVYPATRRTIERLQLLMDHLASKMAPTAR